MIKEYQRVLTDIECKNLIELGKTKLIDATTLGMQIKNYRSAQNTWLFEKNELTDKIKKIVSEKTNLPIENQEIVHIVKYDIGGEYKTHHDFFHPNTDYYESAIKRGGQRVYSCLFYLNDDFEGGETDFPKMNYRATPELGKLIVWRNLNEDNTLNYNSLHAGLPVVTGEKWICIIWVRESNF